jgi:methylated-DNA-[protein]-cysteine S-methyltransferase
VVIDTHRDEKRNAAACDNARKGQMSAALAMMAVRSPIGVLRLYAADDELVGLYLPVQPAPPGIERPSEVLARTAAQLAEYFAGQRRVFDVALAPRGTEFQRAVWRKLRTIPLGETRSYGELARALGRPSASRAVGAANGKNPISIIVPCHRVVGSTGHLTGYAGGVPAKRWLLDHEHAGARRATAS